MRIALIMPPMENTVEYFRGWQLTSADYGSFPPIGLLYIATVLKKNIPEAEVNIFDCVSEKIDYRRLERLIRDFNPDVAGMTVFTACLVDVLNVARLVRALNKNIHICVGGPHLSTYPGQTLRYNEIDSIVVGEGEYAFSELIKRLMGQKSLEGIDGLYIKSGPAAGDFKKAVIKDVDSLPFFDTGFLKKRFYYSVVGRHRHIITLFSSRGCPYNCTFCEPPYRTYRSRSVENIIEEIALRLKEGFREIFFYDDTFNVTPQRVIELSLEMLKKDMRVSWSFRGRVDTTTFEMLALAKRAGCDRVHFGIETATDEGLKKLRKGINTRQIRDVLSWCRKLKIKTIADFIIGLPFEKCRQDVVDNIKRLVKFSPDYAQFNVLQPIPGTEIYKSGIERGVIDPKGWDDFIKSPNVDFEPPIWNEYLNSEELAGLYVFAYRRFYLRPRYVVKYISSLRTPSELKRAFEGGFKLLLRH